MNISKLVSIYCRLFLMSLAATTLFGCGVPKPLTPLQAEESDFRQDGYGNKKLRDLLQDIHAHDPSFLTNVDVVRRLYLYVECGDVQGVRTMLECGVPKAELTKPFIGDRSILVLSQNIIDPKMFRLLAGYGVFDHLSSDDTCKMLSGAIFNGDVPEVRYLINRGALKSWNAQLGSPLTWNEEAEPNQWYMAKALTEQNVTVRECAQGANGRRVGANRSQITRCLLAAGADPNDDTFGDGRPLPFAIAAGDTGSVRQLMAHHAAIDLSDANMRFAIDYARQHKFADILTLIRQ